MTLLSTAAEGQGWIGLWEPGLGDASPVGYFTSALYLLTVVVCARATMAQRARFEARTTSTTSDPLSVMASVRTNGEARLTVLWGVVTLFVAALGINKQLDLQTAVTEALRAMAHNQGWYGQRRALQAVFIGVLAVGGLITAVGTLGLLRKVTRRVRLTIFGLLVLVFYVVLRGASFHRLDAILGTAVVGTLLHRLLEIAALLLVVAGALIEGLGVGRGSRS